MSDDSSAERETNQDQVEETIEVSKQQRALVGFESYERVFEFFRRDDNILIDLTGSKQQQAEFRIAHSQASENIDELPYSVSEPTVRDIPETPEIQEYINTVIDSGRFESYIDNISPEDWEIGLVPIEQLIPVRGIVTVPENNAVPPWDDDPQTVIEEMLPVQPSGNDYFLRDFITEREFGFEFVNRSSDLYVSPTNTAVIEGPDSVQARVVVDVMVEPNFVTVSRFDQRLMLEQGYQRVYQQFRQGATHIPAIVLNRDEYEQIRGASSNGLVSQETILGERPPIIPDFDSKAVVDLKKRARNTIITVSAREEDVVR